MQGGVASACCLSLAASPRLNRLFVVTLLLPSVCALSFSGDSQAFSIAVILVLYGSFLQGHVSHQARMAADVRDRESQYKALSGTAFEGVAISRDGIILEATENMARIFGYELSEFIGVASRTLLAAEDQERVTGLIAKGSEDLYEAKFLRKDGTVFIGEGTGRPCQYRGLPARVSSVRDITHRKKIEDTAIASARLKAEFLANMSHEIRTPLNGIIGAAEMLAEDAVTDHQRKYTRILQDSGTSLMVIINDILDFSKIEAGKLNLETTDFSVVNVVEGQVELLAKRAYDKGLSVRVYVDPEIPSRVQGDPGRLGQVLLNLIGNAIKFTAQGTVAVSAIRAAASADPKGEVGIRFSVRDEGIGIDRRTVNQLFQPFIQADSSTGRKFGGTGLGLSISKRLIELMGGEIGVVSELGQGSEFWFTLSLREVRDTPSEDASYRNRLTGLRALVIDRDADNLRILSSYLRSWGIKPLIGERLPLVTDVHQGGDIVIFSESSDQGDALDQWYRARLATPERHPPCMVVLREGPGVPAPSAFPWPTIFLAKPVRQSELYNAIVGLTQGGASAPLGEPAEERDAAAPARKHRILVAEDNSTNQLLALANLKKLGYAAQVVANGREVLAALDAGGYDLILMDCQMPEMDGMSTTLKIREIERATGAHIPIIALTANAMKEDEARCLECGMDDYISKPVRRQTLKTILEKWLS